MTDQTIAADRPDNLFAAVPGDDGARGRFSGEASERSVRWRLTRHRRVLGAAGLASALGGAAAGAVKLRRR